MPLQKCGICKCPGHRRTNCHVFLFDINERPSQQVDQVRKIKSRTRKPKIETVYECMDSWIAKNGAEKLSEIDYRKFVSHVNELHKSFERFVLDTALKNDHLYPRY